MWNGAPQIIALVLETLSESPFNSAQLRNCTESTKGGLQFIKTAMKVDLEIVCINNIVDARIQVPSNVIDKNCKEQWAKYWALRNTTIQGTERGNR